MHDSEVSSSWRQVTERYREALRALGCTVPNCLSGEEEACGQTDVDHLVVYMAQINGKMLWDVMFAEMACPPSGDDGATVVERFAEGTKVALLDLAPEKSRVHPGDFREVLDTVSAVWSDHYRTAAADAYARFRKSCLVLPTH